MQNGGVVLLFSTGADDYLPARLFSPAYTTSDFCLWITGQAAEARKASPVLNGTGNSAGNDAGQSNAPAAPVTEDSPILYDLYFTLDAQETARLLSRGSKRLYFTTAYWKRQLWSVRWVAAGGFVYGLLRGYHPLLSLLTSLILCGALLLLKFVLVLLRSSRIAYRLEIRRRDPDGLPDRQQVSFYEDHIAICRAAGTRDQSYGFYTLLLDTPEAWFLVSQQASAILPLPKEGLPEYQHTAFAAFVEEKLAAARVRPSHGPTKKL